MSSCPIVKPQIFCTGDHLLQSPLAATLRLPLDPLPAFCCYHVRKIILINTLPLSCSIGSLPRLVLLLERILVQLITVRQLIDIYRDINISSFPLPLSRPKLVPLCCVEIVCVFAAEE